jgi:hypothetical protein
VLADFDDAWEDVRQLVEDQSATHDGEGPTYVAQDHLRSFLPPPGFPPDPRTGTLSVSRGVLAVVCPSQSSGYPSKDFTTPHGTADGEAEAGRSTLLIARLRGLAASHVDIMQRHMQSVRVHRDAVTALEHAMQALVAWEAVAARPRIADPGPDLARAATPVDSPPTSHSEPDEASDTLPASPTS